MLKEVRVLMHQPVSLDHKVVHKREAEQLDPEHPSEENAPPAKRKTNKTFSLSLHSFVELRLIVFILFR